MDRTPIGYGYPEAQFVLGDMQNSYSSFYVRITFELDDDPDFAAAFDLFSSLDIDLGVDDGFVAYIDDVEIRRMNVEGSFDDKKPILHHHTAWRANAASSRVSGYTDLLSPVLLVEPDVDPTSESVLCIQVLNLSSGDDDCLLSVRMHARKRGPFLARSEVDTSQSPDSYVPTAQEVVIRATEGLQGDLRVQYFLNSDPSTVWTSNEVSIDSDPDGPFGDACTYRIRIPGKDGEVANPALPISEAVTYRVFVGDSRVEDDDLTFYTPGQFGDFSFIALGNSGLPTSEQASLAAEIDAQYARFCLALGDIVIRNNRYTSDSEVKELVEATLNEQAVDHRFYNAYAGTLARMPFYTVAGEDDLETIVRMGQNLVLVGDYDQAYCMPEESSFEAGDGKTEKFYSFDYGSAHFVVLRSRRFFLPDGNWTGSLTDDQVMFLQNDLESTNKFWKIVALYDPPYTSSTEDADENFIPDNLEFRQDLEGWFGGFESLGVDLVISGHQTFFEETKAVVADSNGNPTVLQDGPHFVFDTPEDHAPVYVVTGGGGEILWETQPKEEDLAPFTRILLKQHHVTKITVTDNVLTIQPLDTNGDPIDIDPPEGDPTSSTITKNFFPDFLRGDADQNGKINITDAIFTSSYLFLGKPAPHCLDASDADDSGVVNITDSIYTINFLFSGGPEPPAPYPACGPDPTGDALTCLEYDAESCP